MDNLCKNFVIVDIDKNDRYKEIVISDLGLSGDYILVFFRFWNNKIKFFGKIEGFFDYGIFLFGDGKVFVFIWV